jgi:hypothetical protein
LQQFNGVVFVEEHSLGALAVHVAKHCVNITRQTLRENVWTIQLVTNDTTPHVSENIGSCLQQLYVDYNEPIYGNLLYC